MLGSFSRVVAPLAAVVTLFAATQLRAHEDHKCKHLSGPFSSTLVPPPTCTSPVGLCTHGILTGDFDGTYDFTIQTLTPDPNNPGVIIATGKSVITSKKGVMHTNDTSVMNAQNPAAVPFVTTAVVESGTQKYKKTTGQFVASGVLSFITGQAIGSYTADLCKQHKDKDDDDCDDD